MAIDTFLLDLDGVFTDFDESYENIIGVKPQNIHPDSYHKNFARFIDQGGFENAPLVKNAKVFFQKAMELTYLKCKRVMILTSDGGNIEKRDEVMRQKIEWCQKHGIWTGSQNFILSHGWRGKSHYATQDKNGKPTSMLIDDTARNVSAFYQAGGDTILYKPEQYEQALRIIHKVSR